LAQTDEITGLFNQRKLSIDLEQSIIQYNRTKQSFTLLFIDIDYLDKKGCLFKKHETD
jgi:diguanylate cyclase (GGDEF)-like protein